MDEYYGSYPVGPSRKQVILRLAIGAAVVLLIGIFVVWLIFFRHPKATDVTSKAGKVDTSQQQSSGSKNNSKTTPSTGTTGKNSDKTAGTTTKNNGSTGATTNPAPANSGAASGMSSNTPTKTNTTPSPTATSSTGNNSADLSQTGPGSVIGLFALTVVLVASLRRWQLSRRSAA